ncbi:FecR domain-containing protein [uncultured Draconibacterium sp.]|uniref:FecR family protein n=1 Tax=uncultured Draconibacterium sp. TaxID=1573823 RepID=UPI0029C84EBC|nr:FecR domain-containing protein [uncultured Draconibacterium sp.]
MISKKEIRLIDRYFNGETTIAENEKVVDLFATKENDSEFEAFIYDRYEKYINNEEPRNVELSHILDQVHHLIHVKENGTQTQTWHYLYNWYKLAAAVLFLPLVIAGGLLLTKIYSVDTVIADGNITHQTIFAPYGSRISFTLPDGTQGWLNSGSSLDYSFPFVNKRILNVNGEVWFDVAEDKTHPFTVKGGNSTVTVLGTRFNFSAYPDEDFTEVVLEEGSVQFFTPGLSETIRMKPNERLVLSDNAINIDNTDVSKYISWKEGRLVFRGDKMVDVAKRIERWYNVEVEILDKELEEYVFRGTFQDDSLEEVFRYLSMTSPMKYKIIGRKTLEDGTIQKQKVLLFSK